MSGVVCCDTCPFSPTCEEEEDLASHSYRDSTHDPDFDPWDNSGRPATRDIL